MEGEVAANIRRRLEHAIASPDRAVQGHLCEMATVLKEPGGNLEIEGWIIF